MELVHEGEGRYVMICTYREKDIPKAVGLRWDPENKQWWTDDIERAVKLLKYVKDDDTAALLKVAKKGQEEALAASKASTSTMKIPAPEGLEYMPFQKAGIEYASSRPATLIADEMGLGKTIQSLGVINLDRAIRTVLVVCPASLKLNWQREADKWLVRKMKTRILASSDILPRNVPKGSFWIVNYDVFARHMEVVKEGSGPRAKESIKFTGTFEVLQNEFDLLIVDEAHYVKNHKAKRSKAVYSLKGRRRLFLTGTPIVNTPVELWPLISNLDRNTWRSFWYFAKQYCGAYNNGHGWDFKGACNLDELQDKLRRTVMVRRLKRDVLTELPDKVRQVIEIPSNGEYGEIIQMEKDAWEAHEERTTGLRVQVELAKASEDEDAYNTAVDNLKKGMSVAFTEMARIRHEIAVAKLPAVVNHVRDALESHDKVVVFAHHHDVLNGLMEGLAEFDPVKLSGAEGLGERQVNVDRFQKAASCRVFVGQIMAAGVGITLTASSHVIFAELDWVPGNVTQAEDRCHRIGQADSVLVQHIVLEESLESQMAKTIVRKQRVIDDALDVEHPEKELPAIPKEPKTSTRKQIQADAVKMPPEMIPYIHNGLRELAMMCDGASSMDGSGFNKIDAHIGRSLANSPALSPGQAALGRKIIHKYHRQLPAEINEAIRKEW